MRREVRALRGQNLSEDALREVVGDELQCDYWPPGDGLTYSTWLQESTAGCRAPPRPSASSDRSRRTRGSQAAADALIGSSTPFLPPGSQTTICVAVLGSAGKYTHRE